MNTWEANIRKVVPYTPGEQPNEPDMIKLNTNENPYPPAPGVTKALKEIHTDTLRLYPDPTAGDLVHAIAQNYGLKDEQVFVGVGSDDVLAMSFLTFFNSEKPVLFPDITYSFYVNGIALTAQVVVNLSAGSNYANATVYPMMNGNNLTFSGTLVPTSQSGIFRSGFISY